MNPWIGILRTLESALGWTAPIIPPHSGVPPSKHHRALAQDRKFSSVVVLDSMRAVALPPPGRFNTSVKFMELNSTSAITLPLSRLVTMNEKSPPLGACIYITTQAKNVV